MTLASGGGRLPLGFLVSVVLLLMLLCACMSNADKERIAQLEKEKLQMEQQIRALSAAAKSRETVPDNEVFTLYRSSPVGADLRVHVGTFDTRSFDDPTQNKQNNYELCSDAQLNFNERNRGKPVRFWCGGGRFKEKLR